MEPIRFPESLVLLSNCLKEKEVTGEDVLEPALNALKELSACFDELPSRFKEDLVALKLSWEDVSRFCKPESEEELKLGAEVGSLLFSLEGASDYPAILDVVQQDEGWEWIEVEEGKVTWKDGRDVEPALQVVLNEKEIRAKQWTEFSLRFLESYVLQSDSLYPSARRIFLMQFSRGLLGQMFQAKMDVPYRPIQEPVKVKVLECIGQVSQFYNQLSNASQAFPNFPERSDFLPSERESIYLQYLASQNGMIPISSRLREEQNQIKLNCALPFLNWYRGMDSYQPIREYLEGMFGKEGEVEELEKHFLEALIEFIDQFSLPRFFSLLALHLTIPEDDSIEGVKVVLPKDLKDQKFYFDLGSKVLELIKLQLQLSHGSLKKREKTLFTFSGSIATFLGHFFWTTIEEIRCSDEGKFLRILDRSLWKDGDPTMRELFDESDEDREKKQLEARGRLNERVKGVAKTLAALIREVLKENVAARFIIQGDWLEQTIEERAKQVIHMNYELSQMPDLLQVLMYDYALPTWND